MLLRIGTDIPVVMGHCSAVCAVALLWRKDWIALETLGTTNLLTDLKSFCKARVSPALAPFSGASTAGRWLLAVVSENPSPLCSLTGIQFAGPRPCGV